MTPADRMAGGCQCGRIRYEVAIDGDDAYLCHCRMCQRASGGVSMAFRNVKRDDLAWTTRAPDPYASSPIATRGFCSTCGTPLTFEYDDGSENIDLTIGSFDDSSRFMPRSHFGAESLHEAWIGLRDLPRHRSDENQPLIDRWKSVGRHPD